MIRYLLIVVLISGLLIGLGCSSSPTIPEGNNDLESVLGAPPALSGVIGSYTWTGNDGISQTGDVIKDEQGNLIFVADRGSAVTSVPWFNLNLDYRNHRGLYQGKYPIYRRGDTIVFDLHIDYNCSLPLDTYPVLYSKLTAVTRFYPSMVPLPGDSTQIWDPLEIAPNSSIIITGEYTIPLDCYFGWGCTTSDIELIYMSGTLEFNIRYDVLGIFDP
ncbi:hypothetical protein KKB99_00355 [bacterium]|nr:hypothetical protein [bacterium]MBU1024436.1 hypothetical protein [bacterium]